MAPSSHVQKGLDFHHEIPVLHGHDDPQWCPRKGKTTPQRRRHHCHRQWKLSPGTPSRLHALDQWQKPFPLHKHDTSTRRNLAQLEPPPWRHQQAPVDPQPDHQGGVGPLSPLRRKRGTSPACRCLMPSRRTPSAPPAPTRRGPEQADPLGSDHSQRRRHCTSTSCHRPPPPCALPRQPPPPSEPVFVTTPPPPPRRRWEIFKTEWGIGRERYEVEWMGRKRVDGASRAEWYSSIWQQWSYHQWRQNLQGWAINMQIKWEKSRERQKNPSSICVDLNNHRRSREKPRERMR
jgi:hypothetical protein